MCFQQMPFFLLFSLEKCIFCYYNKIPGDGHFLKKICLLTVLEANRAESNHSSGEGPYWLCHTIADDITARQGATGRLGTNLGPRRTGLIPSDSSASTRLSLFKVLPHLSFSSLGIKSSAYEPLGDLLKNHTQPIP